LFQVDSESKFVGDVPRVMSDVWNGDEAFFELSNRIAVDAALAAGVSLFAVGVGASGCCA